MQLIGCATTEQTSTPSVADDKAAAELAELFDDFSDESETPVTETQAVSEPVETPPKDVIEEAVDESIDPLDQIAATAPEPVLPKPHAVATIQIYDWNVIDGAPIGNAFTAAVQNRFIRPVAIAVQGEYLYVVDEGYDALYRLDLSTEELEVIFDLKKVVKGEVADIYVDKDFSFYLTDTEAGRVLHFDQNGRLIQEFRNHFNLVKPVAVTVFESGDLVVADGHYDHLLHFNSEGKLIATYGARGDAVAEFLNILTMAKGPDGFYVGGRVGRRIQVLGSDGNYLYAFEEGTVVFPASIVVDGNNRSYVADYMDNTIKVFDRGGPIGVIGGHGTEPGKFKRVTDLWLVGNVLYIADSLNGRIQAAKLSPDPVPLPSPVFESDAELFQETVEESAEADVKSVDGMAEDIVEGADEKAQPAKSSDSIQ